MTFLWQCADEVLKLVLQTSNRADQLVRQFLERHEPGAMSDVDSAFLKPPGAEPEGLIKSWDRRAGDSSNSQLKATSQTPEVRIKRRHGTPSNKGRDHRHKSDNRGQEER